MVTTVTADKALKSFYLDAVTEALDIKANPFLAAIEKSTADVVGKDVRKLVRYGVNGGIGAGTETGDLPKATGNNYVQYVSTLKNLYGRIEISDKAIRASANNEGAFVNLLNDEMQALIRSSAFNFGRMIYGDGTGVIGEVATDAVLEGTTEVMFNDVRNFVEGMVVDFYSEDGVPVPDGQGRKVVHVDRGGRLVYFDGENMNPDNYPFGTKAYLQGSKDNEITGLGAIFGDTGSLYGVDTSDKSWMKGYKLSDIGDIDDGIIQTAIDSIAENSGSDINFILCSLGVRRALVNYYKSKGAIMNTVELEGGFKALSFNGIPVIADRLCPSGTMYLLNTADFCLHQLCDWQWLEGEDGKILKQIPGKPVYSATLVKYAELMCARPQGQGVITGITEG